MELDVRIGRILKKMDLKRNKASLCLG